MPRKGKKQKSRQKGKQVPRRSHIEADPVPEGWSKSTWYKAFNRADSQFYKGGLEASRAARASGETRALALSFKEDPSELSEDELDNPHQPYESDDQPDQPDQPDQLD